MYVRVVIVEIEMLSCQLLVNCDIERLGKLGGSIDCSINRKFRDRKLQKETLREIEDEVLKIVIRNLM